MLLYGVLSKSQFDAQKQATYKTRFGKFSSWTLYLFYLLFNSPKTFWENYASLIGGSLQTEVLKEFPVMLSKNASKDEIKKQLLLMIPEIAVYTAGTFYTALHSDMIINWVKKDINTFLAWIPRHWATLKKTADQKVFKTWLTEFLKANRPDWETKGKADLVKVVYEKVFKAEIAAAQAQAAAAQTSKTMGLVIGGVILVGLLAAVFGRRRRTAAA